MLLAVPLHGCVAGSVPREWPSREFSTEEWKATQKEGRFVFVRDLQQRGLLAGRSRQEVLELLGSPEFEAQDGSYVTYIVAYRKPGEPSLNAIYLLHLDLERDGRVSQVKVRAD